MTDPLDRTLCCGAACGRGTDAAGPCVASIYGRAIRQRADALRTDAATYPAAALTLRAYADILTDIAPTRAKRSESAA